MFNVPQSSCKLTARKTFTMKFAVIKIEKEVYATSLTVSRVFVNKLTTPKFMIGTVVWKDHSISFEISRFFETKIYVSLNLKYTVSILTREFSESNSILGNLS